jgi:uncharacterized protein (DUF362 family)
MAIGPYMSDVSQLTRRQCLARGAGAVIGAAAAAVGGYLLYDPRGDRGPGAAAGEGQTPYQPKNYFAEVEFPPGNPRLAIATGAEPRIGQMVRAAVGGLDPSLGMRRFVRPGDTVLIKPNAGFDRPAYLGATTHPEVLRATIRLCKEAGAREVLVADNPIESPSVCFAKSGIGPVVQAESAQLVMPRTEYFAPSGWALPTLNRWPVFCEPLARATKLIGIAPVKDHNLCSASMSLKNWYGLLGGRRNQLHQAIQEVISDLALLFSPTLVIADATRVMMRSGPTGGRVSDIQPGGALRHPAVMASVDPVACDAWCYENLLGRDPGQLAYLGLAAEKIQASGAQRFGSSNWRAYERAGQIARVSA